MKKTSLILLILGCLVLLALAFPITWHHAVAQQTADNTQTADDQKPTSTLRRLFELLGGPPQPKPLTEQDKAALEARQGQYDDAIAKLGKMHQKDPNNQSVTRDYLTVLSWAGHDQDAVDLYEKLPPQQPDYVLAAIGHSYRALGQTDKALMVYRIGLGRYPDNVTFAEGEIRCLADKGDLDAALAKTGDDQAKHGDRPEIAAARKDIIDAMVKRDDQKAVEMARAKHYPQALAILHNLYIQHSDNPTVTADYLAVLGWAEGNDDQVIALYKTLPADFHPDYVLKAVGHSYRKLKRPDYAFVVYQEGLQKYPDDVVFAEGSIRSLSDQKKYDDALKMANDDLKAHGNRPEIVDAKKYILKQMPKKKTTKHRHHHSAD